MDLSDEWEALSEQLETAMHDEPHPAAAQAAPQQPPVPVPTPVLVPAEAAQTQGEAVAESPAFDLELQAVEPEMAAADSGALTADSLIADLTDDIDSLTASLGIPEDLTPAPMQSAAPPPPQAPPAAAPAAHASSGNGASGAGSLLSGPLGDLFEEFRSELGETKDDEDLETHYNLGIAYREMGLLEEAISEFQKVASSADKGPAFRYAMQCSTLLGLAFMERGSRRLPPSGTNGP